MAIRDLALLYIDAGVCSRGFLVDGQTIVKLMFRAFALRHSLSLLRSRLSGCHAKLPRFRGSVTSRKTAAKETIIRSDEELMKASVS